ncbi:UNVERIFIED_CONTAM: Pectinesterase 2 [Sesamum radiatum]|uniref:pectinesterase n=1 Tax=Sesamum radiatum TaxID=300843 RepID=A0AAW2JDN3_SESRA
MSMQKLSYVAVEVVFVTALLVLPIVLSTNDEPIPADKAQLNSWFDRNVGPLASREGSLDPAVVEAEKNVTVVQVRADGSGDFKTITDAVKSVPHDNKHRVVISIGPGNYTEKFGTLDSGHESECGVRQFQLNSAPRPDAKESGGLRRWLLKSPPENMRLSNNCRFPWISRHSLRRQGQTFVQRVLLAACRGFTLQAVDNPSIWGAMSSLQRTRGRSTTSQTVCFVHCTVRRAPAEQVPRQQIMVPLRRGVIYAYSQLRGCSYPEGMSNNGQAHYRRSAIHANAFFKQPLFMTISFHFFSSGNDGVFFSQLLNFRDNVLKKGD